jgi:hypothetical protein
LLTVAHKHAIITCIIEFNLPCLLYHVGHSSRESCPVVWSDVLAIRMQILSALPLDPWTTDSDVDVGRDGLVDAEVDGCF